MAEQNNAQKQQPRFLRGAPKAKPLLKHWQKISITVALLFSIYYLVFSQKGLLTYIGLQNDLDNKIIELNELKAEENRLATDIEALKNDPDMLEKVAREEYRMHRPGEKVIEIVGESENDK